MWDWIKKPESTARHAPTVEVPESRPAARVPRKNVTLFNYLEKRYADTVVLTFGQIEDLLGFALPDLARTKPEWWTIADANEGTPPFSDAWTMAGRTASPNLPAKTVVFERTATPR